MAGVDAPLRAELLSMAEEDQRCRLAWTPTGDPAAGRAVADVDRCHTSRMRQIIDTHGWPGSHLVGRDGAEAAWLLVQHADADQQFQHCCLRLLAGAVEAGQATTAQLAYLTDRVAVTEGRPQTYGTQVRTDRDRPEPFPLADPAGIDTRRATVGLPPLADYLASFTAGD
jgi:hypothetical protein